MRLARAWRFEAIRRFAWWRWDARRACHGHTRCCQYTDWPNDNNPGAPWRLR